jgi:predicted RNase H-like HicB family nuclease
MKKLELAVLGEETNSWVIQIPNRQYPGVVIQGDSLKTLYDTAKEIAELTPVSEEAHELAEELCQRLKSHLGNYELALRQNGIALPYSKSVLSVTHDSAPD